MNDKIVGIYLAAGKSTRMGTDKKSLELGNSSLGSFALHTILSSPIFKTFVVTQKDDKLSWLHPSFFYHENCKKWEPVYTHEFHHGQSYSLKAGLSAAQKVEPKAYMIFLADQPFISQQIIQKIVDEYNQITKDKEATSVDFIGSYSDGSVKPPILFLDHVLPDLLTLKGDLGARKLIANGTLKGKLISFDESVMFLDVDTEEDYLSAKRVKPNIFIPRIKQY
ncbi:nucleotidyltransferase family protein [Litchfieldia alkalitelluris]|uniref:nucleotidyltransferase family protein n=1 Tax=Litchfieldia alkalitelluris TaxID=304268 RepID=UPI000997C078|nr:nucleotidyltransferase family protein [Litchfieldia alkalitelluris]